ncbi:TPA: host cell division inhibitor Icd-like protein [Escherichia coli]
MNTGYTPVQGRGFVRPENQNLQNFAEIIPVISGLIGGSETNIVNARALQMFDDEKGVNLTYTPDGNQNMSIISESVFYKLIKTKSAPLPERPCEQLTCCEKNGSVQGNYINRVAKRHNCRITGKTKATRDGGPSTQATRYPQRMSIANNATFAAGGQCDQCAGLLVGCQPLGSMPSLRSLSRQAFFTHELKLPGPATSLICCNNVSSKRMFFFVLPERSNFGFTFSSCIGTYHRYKLKSNGTYHIKNTQPLNTAKPGSAGTLTGLLTTNDRKRIEVAMLNHTTHPQGRDSHNLNKYIWRFIALSTAQPRVITIEATSEQEARQQSPAGCVMVFAARIRQGVRHVQ